MPCNVKPDAMTQDAIQCLLRFAPTLAAHAAMQTNEAARNRLRALATACMKAARDFDGIDRNDTSETGAAG